MYRKIGTVRNWRLALLACFACSCNNDRLETPETDGTTYTYPMRFQGGCGTFDGETSTRAPYVWADGDVIYLHFQVGSKQVRGEALYDFDADLWTVTASEPLASDSEGVCTSVFIHNPSSVSGTKVQLSQQSVVYRDEQSAYSVQDGELTVTGLLLPQTGRIQLRGDANTSFALSGLSFLTAYDTAGDSFTQASSKFTATTQADGRTPYYYATFADEAKRELTFTLNSSVALRRSFGTAVLSTGKSGYITIPTMESHEGWEEVKTAETVKTFTVNGVSFNMILVEKGTFIMGATSEQTGASSDEEPAHSVTLTKSYYIGETEVTQALYKAVMENNLSYYLGEKKPVNGISWNDCQTFVSKLSSMTGLVFRLPTEAEWEFAARGGNSSKGYIYSGSNAIDDVSYHSNSSGGPTEVGKYKSNELGIYDMSGNVSEWCQDWYGEYNDNNQMDPSGPSVGRYRVMRGGSWFDSANGSRVSRREWASESSNGSLVGFRLALSCPQNEESSTNFPCAEAVELGLSVKWASFNVGATKPEEYGGYYAWGETEEKEDYSWETYKWCNGTESSITKYCTSNSLGTVDNKIVLGLEDDVAHVKWGGLWRMPTKKDIQELVNNCTWTWTRQNGVAGYIVRALNGKSIFLPAAGNCLDEDILYQGQLGFYGSSTLYDYYSLNSHFLFFNDGGRVLSNQNRYYGFAVRPVMDFHLVNWDNEEWFDSNRYISYVKNAETKYDGDNMYEYASCIDCPLTTGSIGKIEMKYKMNESSSGETIYLCCENYAEDASDDMYMNDRGLTICDDENFYHYSWKDLNVSITDCMVLTISFKDNYIKLNGVELDYILPKDVAFRPNCFFSKYFDEYDEGRWRYYTGVPEGSKLYYIKLWDENGRMIYLGGASTALNPKTNCIENCWRSYYRGDDCYEFAHCLKNHTDYIPYGGGIDE